jgi:glycosyltransferase involved in cell wall biosynthesis
MTTVAVVIPVWNRASTLGRAIESALFQEPDELVVVDDASTDDSVAVASSYPVTVVRRDAKSANYVQALGDTYRAIASDYVIGMGADDVIYPPFVDFVRQCGGMDNPPGVVFGDYALLREGMMPVPLQVRRHGFSEPTVFTPNAAAARFRSSDARRYECGVGSAIRRDLFLWLDDQEYWRLGPWSDSFGYVAASIRAGCAYVPEVFGGFVVEQAEPSYHQKIIADESARAAYFKEAEAWLSRPEIEPLVKGVQFGI